MITIAQKEIPILIPVSPEQNREIAMVLEALAEEITREVGTTKIVIHLPEDMVFKL